MVAAKKEPKDYAISIDTVREQATAKAGGPGLWFSTSEGYAFFLHYPQLRPREMKKALDPLAETDIDGIAKVLLGDEYDEWVAQGGEADDLGLYMMHLGQDFQRKMQRI